MLRGSRTRSPVALLVFAHGNYRLCHRTPGSPFWTELLQSRAQVVSARVRKEVYLAFEYLRSFDEALDWTAESKFVRECLAPLGSGPFTREEALYFVPLLAVYAPFVPLAEAIVSEGLRREPNDPRFRLFSVFGRSHSPVDLDLTEVNKIYHDAIRQGDTETAALAKAAIEAARRFFQTKSDHDDLGFPSHQLEQMRAMAAEMSDAEFEKFREESDKFIPLTLFDLVMAGVREKPSAQPQSKQGRRTSRRTDHPDLFNS